MSVGQTVGPYLNVVIIFGFVLAGTIMGMKYLMPMLQPIIQKLRKNKR